MYMISYYNSIKIKYHGKIYYVYEKYFRKIVNKYYKVIIITSNQKITMKTLQYFSTKGYSHKVLTEYR